ncbi:hypothetical protein COV82_03640 [Candidatus Peregrinibacteria bacterium CG11_big_fil_rev_8_21_14_0_20_46_8]|nr:MAG: hypothetical protein COV82_03640 [Candidatus Peregrinibacteria bacterium CG11_big_fil_rev_8_21_14_0_20_46_8]
MALSRHKEKIPGIKRIMGVLSGKGGVGKSFITANLALAMAKMGAKVGILDADIACPSLFRIFDISAKTPPDSNNQIHPVEKYGVKIVSMAGLSATEDEAIVWRGPILSKIIQQLLKESLWGELDVLLIDFPTGTSDSTLTILQQIQVDGAILVTTPQSLATIDVRRAGNMVRMLDVPMLGIVENMRGEIFGEGGGSITAQKLHTSFLGSIPLRKQIVEFCDRGTPAFFHMDELDLIFGKIARSTLEQVFANISV